MRIALLLAALLAGCAHPIPAEQASNTEVCRNLLNPEYAPVAQREAARRGLDCGPYLQQRQADSNAMGTAIQLLNQPQQRRQICNSVRIGDSIQTVCN